MDLVSEIFSCNTCLGLVAALRWFRVVEIGFYIASSMVCLSTELIWHISTALCLDIGGVQDILGARCASHVRNSKHAVCDSRVRNPKSQLDTWERTCTRQKYNSERLKQEYLKYEGYLTCSVVKWECFNVFLCFDYVPLRRMSRPAVSFSV